VGKFFPPFAGGMENFLGDLLPALSRQGIEVTALVHSTPGEPVDRHGLVGESMIYRVPCYGSVLYAPVSPGFPFLFNRILKQVKPDIIHLHVPNTSALWIMLLAGASKIPWVVHWHSDIVSSSIDRRLAAAYSLYRPVEQRLLVRSRSIIATSQRYLDSSTPLRRWRDKCTVIPLGLDPARLFPPGQLPLQCAEPFWGGENVFQILAIGRLTYYKGHDVLIRAAAEIDGIRVVIVGEGDHRPELERLIRKLHLQDRVVLSGLLSDAELQALMVSSNCLCLPSVERTEAFGLVLLEAMRYGKPLVAGDVPGSGIGWVVRDGITGYLFPVGSVDELARTLNRLVREPEKGRAMGLAGRQRFESLFHIDRVAEKTIGLYHEILSDG
jgi:rhamnosyl/mannosyltransferase